MGDNEAMLMRVAHRVHQRAMAKMEDMQRRLFGDLTDFEKTAERFAPGSILADKEADTDKAKPGKATKEPLAESAKIIKSSSHPDLTLTSVPVVRHWLFAPDGTRLRSRSFTVRTRHRRRAVTQCVTIGDSFSDDDRNYGVLTARHQRALFGLQDLWQRQGGRVANVDGERRGTVSASSWDLEDAIFGHHGGRTKRLVRQIVQQLASIPVAIENYIGPDGEVEDIDVTGLLAGAVFRPSRRGSSEQLGFPWVEILLGSIVTDAFDRTAVKPINIRVLTELGGGAAAVLYPKLDHLLSAHEETELRLDGLVERLGMTGNKQMHQRSYRRKKFEPVVERLTGQPLSRDGYVIDAKLEPTADGEDHKLVARRKRR